MIRVCYVVEHVAACSTAAEEWVVWIAHMDTVGEYLLSAHRTLAIVAMCPSEEAALAAARLLCL